MVNFPADVPTLSDDVVTLRAHHPGDADRIIEFANDERSRRFIPLPDPYGPQQAQEFLDSVAINWAADPVHPVWAIEVDGQFAGGINLHPRGSRTWEVGYSMHPELRGRGVMTRAVRLVVDHAFGDLDALAVTWRCGAGNFASWRAVWAAGFAFDGVWRRMHRGSFGGSDNLWLGSLTRAEWGLSLGREHRAARPWWEAKLLRGERVVLRPYRDHEGLSDGPDEIAQRFNADMQPRAGDFPRWLRDRRRRMAIGDGVFWCIADAATDELLGHIQVTRLDVDFIRGTGWVGYWLLPSARGRGVLAEALDLLIPHAFADRTDSAGVDGGLGLHRLYAGTDEDHRASQRALRRAGFTECATERAALAHDDRPHSGAISFELLASDDRATGRIAPFSIPTLRTERFVLREWTYADTPRPEHVTDPDARRFMTNELPTEQTFPDFMRRHRLGLDRRTSLNWCIEDANSGEPLGNVGLFDIGAGTTGNAEVGYWLWQSARGRRVIAQVLPAVLDHGFDELGLTRIHAATDLDNIASQKILLRAGFRQWGADHQAYTNADGSVTDGAYFELLATERHRTVDERLPHPVRTDDVRLRPLQPSDLDRAHEASVDPSWVLWLDGSADRTLQQTREWISRERQVTADRQRWAICAPDGDEFLGCVTVQNIDQRTRSGELGYWVHPDARGRGLAVAAVNAAAGYAFSPEGLAMRRLSINVAEGNEPSIAVAQRTGFRQTGRDSLTEPLGDGSVVDRLRFERLAPD